MKGFTDQNLENFIYEARDGKLKRYYRS